MTKDAKGQTACHCATYHGNIDVLERVTQSPFDLKMFSNLGSSPVHCAAFSQNLEIVDTLIKCGAEITQCDTRGLTIGHLAASKGGTV